MSRQLTCAQALREAQDLCLAADPSVFLMGLGVPDPKGIFGTTSGLAEAHGAERVFDMPCAENAMTGVAIGAALAGMRPVMTHQRVDFALLALEQLCNQAANWRAMFAGQQTVPLTVRLMVGRGWGQGPQHSQCLHAWLAHVPGLKVVMPTTPHDAKGLLIAAIEDDDPVVFIEHRWLHGLRGEVPEGHYTVPLGQAKILRPGRDVTLVASSHMTIEAMGAAQRLADEGVEAEVIDLRTISPWDRATVLDSVRRTGRLVAADGGWLTAGFAAEIVATVSEACFGELRAAPRRVTLPDAPTPTSPALAAAYYPTVVDLLRAVDQTLGRTTDRPDEPAPDVPNLAFTGPF